MLRISFAILIFAMTVNSKEAQSYPVIDDVKGLPYPELITVYPDFKDPNKYYFVPTSVALVEDSGSVRLGVQHWGLTGPDPAGTGAGLTFSVEPAFDRETVEAVYQEIKINNPNATFAFPALTKSRMDIILNGLYFSDQQDTNQSTNSTGGTVDSTQGFSIGLSNIGARAFAQGVSKDSDVLGATYTYSFLGIEKRLHAKITVNFKKVYTHFSTAGSANAWWGAAKASWQADWQKLTQNEGIKIEILDGGETDTDEYILEVFKKLVDAQINGEGIFKPSLRPAGLSAKPESARSGWGFSKSVAWEKLEEDKTLVFEINKQKLGEREFSAGLTFAAVCAKYPDSFVDLTTLGNQCIDRSSLKKTAQLAVKCLEAKLRRLKKWYDDGLLPLEAYLSEIEKARDSTCFGEGYDVAAAAFESALKKIAAAANNGQLTQPGYVAATKSLFSDLRLFETSFHEQQTVAITEKLLPMFAFEGYVNSTDAAEENPILLRDPFQIADEVADSIVELDDTARALEN